MKNVGSVMIGMGIIHLFASFVLFSNQLLSIWQAGPLSGLSWSMEMLAAFWFLIFTWLMIVTGVLFRESYCRHGDIPGRRFVGISFLVVPVVSGIFLPASGLWAFLVPAAMLLMGKPERPV